MNWSTVRRYGILIYHGVSKYSEFEVIFSESRVIANKVGEKVGPGSRMTIPQGGISIKHQGSPGPSVEVLLHPCCKTWLHSKSV